MTEINAKNTREAFFGWEVIGGLCFVQALPKITEKSFKGFKFSTDEVIRLAITEDLITAFNPLRGARVFGAVVLQIITSFTLYAKYLSYLSNFIGKSTAEVIKRWSPFS